MRRRTPRRHVSLSGLAGALGVVVSVAVAIAAIAQLSHKTGARTTSAGTAQQASGVAAMNAQLRKLIALDARLGDPPVVARVISEDPRRCGTGQSRWTRAAQTASRSVTSRSATTRSLEESRTWA